MSTESEALLWVLRHQAAVLTPVVAHLHVAAAHPPVAPHDWNGPASLTYAELEAELRWRITAAVDAVAAALDATRLALGQLDA